ncbi:hypothetical protein BDF22DRAFT_385318 [Syncephalis plumigaleata]|nr:hypothetical protein BDF22DRAFT_385318 [Syncephalis plumigaleata]
MDRFEVYSIQEWNKRQYQQQQQQQQQQQSYPFTMSSDNSNTRCHSSHIPPSSGTDPTISLAAFPNTSHSQGALVYPYDMEYRSFPTSFLSAPLASTIPNNGSNSNSNSNTAAPAHGSIYHWMSMISSHANPYTNHCFYHQQQHQHQQQQQQQYPTTMATSNMKQSLNYPYDPSLLLLNSMSNPKPHFNPNHLSEASMVFSNIHHKPIELDHAIHMTPDTLTTGARTPTAATMGALGADGTTGMPPMHHQDSGNAASCPRKDMSSGNDFSMFLDGYFGQRRSYRVGTTMSSDIPDRQHVVHASQFNTKGGGIEHLTTIWEKSNSSHLNLAMSTNLLPHSRDTPSPSSLPMLSDDEHRDTSGISSPASITGSSTPIKQKSSVEALLDFTSSSSSSSQSIKALGPINRDVLEVNQLHDNALGPILSRKEESLSQHGQDKSIAVGHTHHSEESTKTSTRTFDVLEIWQMNDPCADFRHEIAMNTMARQGYYPRRPPTGVLTVKSGANHGKRSNGRRNSSNNSSLNSNSNSQGNGNNTSKRAGNSSTHKPPPITPPKSSIRSRSLRAGLSSNNNKDTTMDKQVK